MLKLDRQTNKLRGDARALRQQLAAAADERDALAEDCEARVAAAVERAAAASAAADARAEEATARPWSPFPLENGAPCGSTGAQVILTRYACT